MSQCSASTRRDRLQRVASQIRTASITAAVPMDENCPTASEAAANGSLINFRLMCNPCAGQSSFGAVGLGGRGESAGRRASASPSAR